ncbi:unnamed protein product [Mycena citricolor]|uniref:Uncharacterized protein n=1 Tax=Mycena citricolor TaxID=2018698 RepID=A0AAD2Q4H2_9AGAR|nr:unnamed protein product [Mycena citricolor]
MEHIFARFRRGRAKSDSAAVQSGLPLNNLASTVSSHCQQRAEPLLERRIHPDLDALVASWTHCADSEGVHESGTGPTEATSATEITTALRPSARRHSISGTTPVIRRPDADDEPAGPSIIPVSFAGRTQSRLSRITSRTSTTTDDARSPSAADWSTFGRDGGRRVLRVPMEEFGVGRASLSLSQSETSNSQWFSHSRPQTPATPSTASHQRTESVPESPQYPSFRFTFGSDEDSKSARSASPASNSPRAASGLALPEQPGRIESRPSSPSSQAVLDKSVWLQRRVQRRNSKDRASVQDIFDFPASSRRPGQFRRHSHDSHPSPLRAALKRTEELYLGLENLADDSVSEGGNKRDSEAVTNLDHDFDARDNLVDPSSSLSPRIFTESSHSSLPTPHSLEPSTSAMDPTKVYHAPRFAQPHKHALKSARSRAASEGSGIVLRPRPPTRSISEVAATTKDKRKARISDSENTPPLSIAATNRRTRVTPTLSHSRSASSSQAPSSYTPQQQRTTRLRPASDSPPSPLSTTSDSATPESTPPRRSKSTRSSPASVRQTSRATSHMSQTSLPISALVSPHAPSIARSAGTNYHMRDPRKAPRVQPTGWAPIWGTSPAHAWLFFLGFVVFPLWWIAGLLVPVPRTRKLDVEEKAGRAVVLDDPQIESDALSWRKRCRIMAGVSLVTYIPFIVLLVVFLTRS